MRKFMNSKWFYLILSLFFALLLYFNANNTGSNIQSIDNSDKNGSYQQITTKVPITFKYDENKYYITSDDTQANVKIASSNQVLLDMESNNQTRKFQVVADLRGYGPGTYEIPLKVSHLNHSATATIQPKTVKVTVEERMTRTFNIQTNVDSSWIANGYQLKKVTVSPKQVTVGAGAQSMRKIQQVLAIVPKREDVSSSFNKTVSLQAVDASGNEVPVKFNTSEATVSVEVDSPNKEVPINLLQKGKNDKVDSYQLLCDTQAVTLRGSAKTLEKIKGIDVDIDISHIDKTETKEFKLDIPSGVKSNVDKISVTIVPETDQSQAVSDSRSDKKDSESSTDSTSQSSTESTSTTSE